MFVQYAKCLGDEISKHLNEYGLNIKHNDSYYEPLGLNLTAIQNDVNTGILNDSFYAISFELSYITDFTCTKYYSQNEAGDIHLWDYDFNIYFPVSCRPVILLGKSTEEMGRKFEQAITSIFANNASIKVPHPVIPNEYIVLKLSIDANHNPPLSDEWGYSYISCLNNITVPWSNGKQVSDKTHLVEKQQQITAMRQIKAFFELSSNASNYYNQMAQKGDTEKQKAKELISSINDNRISLLRKLDIQESMWTMQNVDYILAELRGPNGNNGIWEICKHIDAILVEQKAEKNRRMLEAAEIKPAVIEPDVIIEPEYADNSGNVYYTQNNFQYNDYSSSNESSGFFSNLAASYIANMGVKKAIKDQTRLMEEQERRRREEAEAEKRERAHRSQVEWENVRKQNIERRRKGLPELPYPERFYW